ncbi:MAG TPA: sigma 54-interacting transcriptional regulator [Polyangiaceae bacterium]|nr:sigma 54-interacting transcriptional regulator [Polyangiaceae bacterium]
MNDALLLHPRYAPGEVLGQGAQGVVLRVTDREQPAHPLVAKLWQRGAFDESALAGEFALLRRLSIPGLVGAHDWGRDERTQAPFFVEDFVAGEAAFDFVQRVPEQRAQRLLGVLSAVTTTLAALHDAAFVHGDLKPAHVRVTPRGDVRVLDLGAAVARAGRRATGPSAFTPAFAAPELLAGAAATSSSDLFSLGALAWALATGAAPGARSKGLRTLTPWVPPSISGVIEQLLARHPRDRPASADDVLQQLGLSGLAQASRSAPAPIGRERELDRLREAKPGVRYLSGPSGSGKSHLLRELVTQALLAGRSVRRVSFPGADQALLAQLIAFFRGADAAWPFTARAGVDESLLLFALDDLHAAPPELAAALDAFRCRGQNALGLDIIASVREAPEGAPAVTLGPLTDDAFASMCRQLGMDDAEQIAAFARMSGRSPGFAVAARGRVPLTRDAILARAAELSRPAAELLARIALLGGVGGDSLVNLVNGAGAEGASASAALAELLGAALLTRKAGAKGVTYTLGASELAPEVAGALGSFELAEDTCRWALTNDSVTPRALMALASGPFPPQARRALLERAVAQARREGLAGDETEALFALLAEPQARTRELVLRLERLTRNAGSSHPQVMAWLSEVAELEPSVLPLLRRRQAEQAARAGDTQLAAARADEARAAAQASGDRGAEALALATRGAVALYRADVALAEAALRDAAVVLSTLELGDPEELARLEHNSGVVALYGDRIDDAVRAFERSLDIKRRLGDRAGVRSCLLNLGLAQSRRGLYDAATATLSEAIALAQALKQPAGRAWCLAARADVEVRRGDARRAEQLVAEAEAIVEAPPVVRADLAILRGQAALLTGDAKRARAALTALTSEQRTKDALLDARARVIEAGALLASLPARPREAARLCVQVVRAARSARLFEVEAQALALLGKARSQRAAVEQPRYAPPMQDGGAELWSWLAELASGVDAETAVLQLLRALRQLTGAERALLVACGAEGELERAWGVDLDGFALASALERCDAAVVQDALQAGAPLYQRDIATLPGRGARLLVPQTLTADGRSAVLLFEHRFQPRAFDAVESEQAVRFAVLAGLALRHVSVRTEASEAQPLPLRAPPSRRDSNETTVLPLREARRAFPAIVGKSRALQLALTKLDAAIGSELPVLISGETGTGKELFARALHELGPRARGPLVAINCAAVPDALFEAELFGHARGAFTGAERARPGLLARAEGGTLFLDEIAELPLARQASLLRVLESRRYRPVGSDEERALDVNIVAAANRSLADEVANGKFRQDLLFRLNVIEIVVPPLRDRLDDVPLLVRAFIERQGASMELSAAALTALEGYGWPGNVRELEHHVQRLLALGVPRIERAHLPRSLRPAVAAGRAGLESARANPTDPRDELTRALEQAQGNITHAARALGLTRHGLKKRMLRLGLRVAQKEQA